MRCINIMTNKVILLMSILVLINFISAAQITNINPNSGLQLKIPIEDTFRYNSDYEFEVHVFNISNGLPVTSGISCYFHMYNKSGNHIVELADTTISHNFDYSFMVEGENFTLGGHTLIIQCNSSTLGGFFAEFINVTNDGTNFIYSKELFIITLLVISLILFIIGMSFSNDKWLIKSSFIILSLFLCILTLNSIYNFIGESSTLNIMSLSGLIILFSIIMFLLLYMFIMWTIDTIKNLKEKEGIRWKY